MARSHESVGRALKRALKTDFVLPEIEAREGGTSLLMNRRRQRVFEHVWNHPCHHLRGISRDLQIPAQSLRWHLIRLERSAILTSRPLKGKSVYYAPWALREEDVPLFASLSNGTKRRIVAWVAARTRTTQSEIFHGLGTYQQALLPSLAELVSLGLLRTWKEDARRFYELGPAYARLRESYAAAHQERVGRLLAILTRDGVSPKIETQSAEEIQIQVSNGVQKSALRLTLVPTLN